MKIRTFFEKSKQNKEKTRKNIKITQILEEIETTM